MSRDPDRPWWMPLATAVGAAVVWVLGRTWRIERVGDAGQGAARTPGAGPCLFVFWHARMLPLIFAHRGRGGAVLISRSRDGELVAGIVERLGFVTARGSSTRGGGEGVQELLRWGAEGRELGVTPDGPLGPPEEVKPGLVTLASRCGCPVIPLATAARAACVFPSWDRFRVPLPFSRVVIGYGEPIQVPPGLDEQETESWRRRLEEILRAHTREVARRAGEPA